MKIALMNEFSQASKNPIILKELKSVVEPMGHTVYNTAMVKPLLDKDVPEAYLFCQDIERVYNSNLEGYKPSTFNEFYNVHNWEVK